MRQRPIIRRCKNSSCCVIHCHTFRCWCNVNGAVAHKWSQRPRSTVDLTRVGDVCFSYTAPALPRGTQWNGRTSLFTRCTWNSQRPKRDTGGTGRTRYLSIQPSSKPGHGDSFYLQTETGSTTILSNRNERKPTHRHDRAASHSIVTANSLSCSFEHAACCQPRHGTDIP